MAAAAAWYELFDEERFVREKIKLEDLTESACFKWCGMPKKKCFEDLRSFRTTTTKEKVQ